MMCLVLAKEADWRVMIRTESPGLVIGDVTVSSLSGGDSLSSQHLVGVGLHKIDSIDMGFRVNC